MTCLLYVGEQMHGAAMVNVHLADLWARNKRAWQSICKVRKQAHTDTGLYQHISWPEDGRVFAQA